MRFSLLLAFLSCCCCAAVQAQTIEPGYLVISSGDTLRGEVENAFWEDPPASVRFRLAPNAELTSYQITELRSVGLASGRLLRKEVVPIDLSAQTSTPLLSAFTKKYQQPKELLADVLVIGPASLLAVTVNNVHHFFVRRENQPYLEMTERKYLEWKNGRQVIMDGNDYKSQLLRYFGDCNLATLASAKAPFTAAGLTTVVQVYNQNCSATRQAGQEITVNQSGAEKVAVRVGALLGARYNSLPITGINVNNVTLAGLDADGRVHPEVGAYLDVVGPGRRFALHTALLVSQFGKSTPTSFQTGEFRWHGTLVVAHFGARSFIPVGEKTRILVGIGYEVNTTWNFTSELDYGGGTSNFLDNLSGTRLYAEAGFTRERLGLTFNGRGYGTEQYILFKVPAWSLNAVLSYRLNANPDTKAHGKR